VAYFVGGNINNPHIHGKPDFEPEPIEVDYENELTLRYRKYSEYPEGRDWWNMNPIIEVDDE
jgi:hypothetical protein